MVMEYSDINCEPRSTTEVVSPELRYQQEIQSIQASAMNAIMRNGLTLQPIRQANMLSSLIKIFDTRILELGRRSQSLLSK
jgi:hypothetical protein